jgi:repressor LexA
MIQDLGKKVRRLRERVGMNQTELALILGLSAQSKGVISEIESGKKLPKAELIVRLAQYFDVSTDYLLRDDIDVVSDEFSRSR